MSRVVIALGLVLPLAGGCGLISSDIADFTLSLPEKTFEVDSADWGLTMTGTVPELPCATNDTCQALSATACSSTAECEVACGEGGSCQVTAFFSQSKGVDMAAEKPEIKDIDKQAGVKVTITSIDFTIDENTLNVATPVLQIWAATASVTEPGVDAQLVGHIASIPAGSRTTARIDFEPGGEAILSSYLSAYDVPFNIIVGGDVVMEGGAPVPQGRVSGRITGTATASAL